MKKILTVMIATLLIITACNDDSKVGFTEGNIDYKLDGLNKFEADQVGFYSSGEFENLEDSNNFIDAGFTMSIQYESFENITKYMGAETEINDMNSYYDLFSENYSKLSENQEDEIDDSEDFYPIFNYVVSKTDIKTRGVKGILIKVEPEISNIGEASDDEKQEMADYLGEDSINYTYVYEVDNGLILIYRHGATATDETDKYIKEVQETIYIKE